MASVISSWYPAPCQGNGCLKPHRQLSDGNRFHPGHYIQIKGWDSYEVCRTKLNDTREVIPIPKGLAKYEMKGVMDIRLFILGENLKFRFFEYVTEDFPVEILDEGDETGLAQVLQESIALEEVSKGI